MAKILVGMSGGVDSAVAAYLLKEAGHNVVGVTLRTWETDDGTESRCCEIEDARAVAWNLGIPFYAWNCLGDFREKVVEPFIHDYICGLTPNPCIECNRFIKWERLMYIAKVLRADYIATGHYASIVRLDNGRYTVQKAAHAAKDQTYMLYKLTQEQLRETVMPLGNLTKEQVRHIAQEAKLPVAQKPDSQEVCFVTEGHYDGFIEENAREPIPEGGDFVDDAGHVLGRHKGIIHYTVGQRKGLGLALGYPAYVKKICPDTRQIVIGREDSLYCCGLICRSVHFMSISGLKSGEELGCLIKVRYHHPGQAGILKMYGPDLVQVTFESPVRSAAPGQSAVFYDDRDCVIGGGIISEVLFP